MKLIRITALLLITLSLEGCGFVKTYKPAPDVFEATFYSPKGEFEITQFGSSRNVFYASDGDYSVQILSLFPIDQVSTLNIGVADTTFIVLNPDDAYYQLNKGEKHKLNIKQDWYYLNKFRITASPSMDKYTYSGGMGLRLYGQQGSKIESQAKDKMDDETYRYYIPFKLDGQDYAVDITFRLDYYSRRRIGIPGAPP